MSDYTFGGAIGHNGNVYCQMPSIASKLLDLGLVLEADKWTADGSTYKYDVAVSGLPESISPVFVVASDDDDVLDAYALIDDIETADGHLYFTASGLPTVDIPIVAKGTIASRYNAIEDLAGVIDDVTELTNNLVKSEKTYSGIGLTVNCRRVGNIVSIEIQGTLTSALTSTGVTLVCDIDEGFAPNRVIPMRLAYPSGNLYVDVRPNKIQIGYANISSGTTLQLAPITFIK